MKVRSEVIEQASKHVLEHDVYDYTMTVFVDDIRGEVTGVDWQKDDGYPPFAWKMVKQFCKSRGIKCPKGPGVMSSMGVVW